MQYPVQMWNKLLPALPVDVFFQRWLCWKRDQWHRSFDLI